MKKLVLVIALLLFATPVLAEELIEEWPDPLGGWRDRWVAQNTNMQNYYICSGGNDEDDRGNNPCGLWICDGTIGGNCTINFEPGFGASIDLLEMRLQAFVDATLNVYDMDNGLVDSFALPPDFSDPYGCYGQVYTVDTPNGVSYFEIVSDGQVEGNMAIDDMRVVIDEPVATEETSWGRVKTLYR